MAFQIAFAGEFPYELGNVPKKVQKACLHWQESILSQEISPNRENPPKIKRLKEFKELWRLRVGDNYRLIYRVDIYNKVVTMIMIDHRRRIYERLGSDDDGKPGIRAIANAHELLERTPTNNEIEKAKAELAEKYLKKTPFPPADLLPIEISKHNLIKWGIPDGYHDHLINLKTEGDLLNVAGVPDYLIERIIEFQWPSNVEEIIQKPTRRIFKPVEIEEAAEGKRKIESFLLMLDEEQLEFVTRFENKDRKDRPEGPWLLKGGPGSGKSTIALYCIRSLLQSLLQLNIFEKDRPLKILYTTYTNSLVRVSEHLIKVLCLNDTPHKLEVKTVDSLAYKHLPHEWKQFEACRGNDELLDTLTEAIEQCRLETKQFSFYRSDKKFLIEEIDWVIIGQDIKNVDEYITIDRSGRGRALGKQQRKHLWLLYEKFLDLLREKGSCLFSERLRYASQVVTPDYDYIFIDEAQDLKPVAIRFLMGLCHKRKNIFLTADINQSIWGYSFSWTKMANDLKVQGRARILKRNYRTTKEIWNAVMQLAPTADDADPETLYAEAVYRGPKPIKCNYKSLAQQEERINKYIFEALREERATSGNVAVLCPTSKEIASAYQMIDKSFKPKVMKSNEVDITWPGVKIMTMHAAKGLEFPIVALFGLEKGRLPLPPMSGISKDEHYAQQKRLLFVACSRAMRRLIVFANKDRPSMFTDDFSDEHWHVEEL